MVSQEKNKRNSKKQGGGGENKGIRERGSIRKLREIYKVDALGEENTITTKHVSLHLTVNIKVHIKFTIIIFSEREKWREDESVRRGILG